MYLTHDDKIEQVVFLYVLRAAGYVSRFDPDIELMKPIYIEPSKG